MTQVFFLNETDFTSIDGQDITICLMKNDANDYFYELSYYDSETDDHYDIEDESLHADYLEKAIIDVCFDYPEAIGSLMSQLDMNSN